MSIVLKLINHVLYRGELFVQTDYKSLGGGNGSPLQYSCLGKILWTQEPGGLQSTGSQKVRHADDVGNPKISTQHNDPSHE